MQISFKQLVAVTQCSNGFIGAATEVLGANYDDSSYELTQSDVSRIEAVYERDFGTPAPIGSDTVFGPVTPEMYSEASAVFYNQVVAARNMFALLGFEFAARTSTI